MRKFLSFATIFLFLSASCFASPDTLFMQPVSEKSTFDESLKGANPSKMVVDNNGVVYVLTNLGVGRLFENKVIKDILYRPLQDRIPVDIAVQEGTHFLYYLYHDVFLSNARAGHIYEKLPPGKFTIMQISHDGSVLLHGPAKSALFSKGKWTDVKNPGGKIINLFVHDHIFYALTKNAVYILQNSKFALFHEGRDLQNIAFRTQEMVVGTSGGYYGVDLRDGKKSFDLKTKIPIQNIGHILSVHNQLWAGTPNGAFMEKHAGGFDYYASKRWLLEDSILAMAKGNSGEVYFLNASGVNKISFQPHSYHQKAVYYQDKIRQRHIRYGLLAELNLKIPGDLSSAEMIDTDNDGLWSSFYLGSQAFRYAVTKEPIAKEYVWETFEAYERLISINQLKGFPSRTFERTGFKVSDPNAWRIATDPDWEWKGTTSSDEFVGYIFVAALMDQFITENNEEKKRVADFMDQILTHMIENGYNFVDKDGKPTRWGRWHPDYINSYAKTISDRKLGATHLIAGLQLGYALTGKEMYKKEAFRLMKEHGYLENILISPYNIKATEGYMYDETDMGVGPWNHSDDEMEFLSYWVLHHYAFDKGLQKQFGTAIKEFWEIELPERHPVWNLITYGTEGSFDKESTLWYLREFPTDLIRWDFKNSIRKDLDFLEPNFRQQFTKELLSPRERPTHRYNANEFRLDGGSGGMRELSGAEYLLPYWMARYLKVIPY